ncbi:hypothetical protein Q8F55_001771 [Vanrija albida]|uniref:Uncharacterized protein n=1 Tax=Vanrija albida TaxID=181172 RepID=A0ABR3Q7W7_9TREE
MSSPPRYTATQYGAADDDGASASAPLLGASSQSKPSLDAASAVPFALQAQAAASSSAARNAWMDTPDDDIPDDFKVGVAVIDCDEVIRRAFIRKVYAILLAQLALTAAVSVSLSFDGPREFVQNNPWVIFTSLIGSFASLFGVYWKRHNYPANMFVLAAFTFFESIMIGSVTSYYDSKIVIQALVITTGVFVGLTLFTFQTKFDFSSFGPFLFAGLWGLITAGLVGIFLPYNQTFDLVISCVGVIIFSGLVLYDTQQIMKRLSVDEAILGSLTLYLDFLNLFLYILRLLNNQRD